MFLEKKGLDKETIIPWLNEYGGYCDCEGISDAEIFQEGVIIRYSIRPGGGAQFAEVRVNWTNGEVVVRTYWS